MAFWDCRITRLELAILVSGAAAVVLLHLDPVLRLSASQALVWALAAMCWLTPMTGMMYTACAQFLPFPAGSFMNPAQVGFVTWAVVTVIRYRRIRFRGIQPLIYVVPVLLWVSLTTGSFLAAAKDEYFKALGYALVACQQVSESRGRYMKLLLGLGLGSLLVTVAYWGYIVGLPVPILEWGTTREGIRRIGGTRADAVMVWPAVLFALSVLIGVATASLRSPRPAEENWWVLPLGVIALCIGVPALISTMTTGGYSGFMVLLTAYAVLFPLCFRHGEMHGKVGRRFIVALSAVLVTMGVLLAFDAFGLRTRVEAMWRHQQRVKEEQSLAASREDVWTVALNTIAQHPWAGITYSGEDEEIPREYQHLGFYLSHNVFLDYGRGGGIPAILMFGAFFLYPAVAMLRRRRRQKYFPFLLLHVAFLVFFMGLSFQYYKTFWAGWMLMAMAVKSDTDGPRRGSGKAR